MWDYSQFPTWWDVELMQFVANSRKQALLWSKQSQEKVVLADTLVSLLAAASENEIALALDTAQKRLVHIGLEYEIACRNRVTLGEVVKSGVYTNASITEINNIWSKLTGTKLPKPVQVYNQDELLTKADDLYPKACELLQQLNS